MNVRALSVSPGTADSARLETRALSEDDALYTVESLLVGVCGTDHEILAGAYGEAPPDDNRLVLGHEAVGRVVRAPARADLAVGDHVVPIVRRPDPVPCPSCAVGEWDMCQNGQYTEHGIRGAHGFARTHYQLRPGFAVAVPAGLGDLAVLVEPASVVAKAWDQVDRIGARAHWRPTRALVTGAGPIGLLAALMARQRGLDTAVLDRVEDGPKPALVKALGASYHTGAPRDAGPAPDVVIECTGAGSLVLEVVQHASPLGIVCLAGLSSGRHRMQFDATELNRELVLDNNVVFGTVNANRRHYDAAVRALADADRDWLARLISRRVPLDQWCDAFARQDDDVKVVLDVRAAAPG